MRVSTEHARLERRIKSRWREYLQSDPDAKRKSRHEQAGHVSSLSALNNPAIYRLMIWSSALAPFPQSWMFCVLFATWVTFFRAVQLTSRGDDEAIIGLYGADDTGILALSRRWMRSIAIWGVVDASMFLGIWWLTGRVPGWAVALGIPCYVLGSMVGPRLLASVFPSHILGIACSLGGMLAFVGAILLMQDRLSESSINAFIWSLGAVSPSGWTILMVRDVVEGHLLLWTVIPLLVVSAVVTRSIARTQEHKLLESVARREFFDQQSPKSEEFDAKEDHQLKGNTLRKELAAFRQRALLDYPWEAPSDPNIVKRAAWWAMIILAVAGNVRLGIIFPDHFRYVVFVGALAGAYFRWMPLLGVPSWLNFAFLSTNRVASAFVLFPVPFRRLLNAQILRDLREAARVAPLLFAVSTAAFAIAFPVVPLIALGCGLGITIFFLLKLPLRWFHLAMWPISNRPFRIGNIMRGLLIAGMLVIFLLETISAITFAYLSLTTQLESFSVIFFVVLGLINGALGMLGAYVALSAYEKQKVDVIKPPPRS